MATRQSTTIRLDTRVYDAIATLFPSTYSKGRIEHSALSDITNFALIAYLKATYNIDVTAPTPTPVSTTQDLAP